METELINLELDEVSLVPAGDDPLAKVAIIKCRGTEKTKKETKMTEEMKAKLKPYMDKGMSEEEAMKAYEEDMKKELDTLKAQNETLRKALLDNGFKITKEGVEKKAPAEYIEVEGEQILKSDIPAPILKRLEEAEEVQKAAAIEKKATETLPNVKKDVAVKLVKADLTEDEELLEFFRAVDAMFAKSMEEAGETRTDADMGSAEDKLEGLAKAYAKDNNTTFHKAYAEVVKTAEGKALYKAMKEDK